MDPVTRERLQALYQRAMASGTTSRGEHATPEALLAVVERRGSDDDRLLTMDHVMGCASCREGFDLLRAVHDAEPQRARPARPAWQTAWNSFSTPSLDPMDRREPVHSIINL